jgi:adenylosuccinate lyase
VRELVVYPEAMRRNLDALHGLIYSQRVLHLLIERGMMRERAYEIVQRNSLRSWEEGVHLRELLANDPESPLDDEALREAFDPSWYLRHVDEIFGRFGL